MLAELVQKKIRMNAAASVVAEHASGARQKETKRRSRREVRRKGQRALSHVTHIKSAEERKIERSSQT